MLSLFRGVADSVIIMAADEEEIEELLQNEEGEESQQGSEEEVGRGEKELEPNVAKKFCGSLIGNSTMHQLVNSFCRRSLSCAYS